MATKMPTEQVHKKYVDYINNTNLQPLPVSHFDEDWEPVGALVRRNMVRDGLIQERDGGIYLRPDLVKSEGKLEMAFNTMNIVQVPEGTEIEHEGKKLTVIGDDAVVKNGTVYMTPTAYQALREKCYGDQKP